MRLHECQALQKGHVVAFAIAEHVFATGLNSVDVFFLFLCFPLPFSFFFSSPFSPPPPYKPFSSLGIILF